MLRSSRLVIALPLHRAERQAFDQVALGIERQQQGRRDGQHDRGGDLAVLDPRGRHESERADRHRLFRRGGQDQREDEIVPGEDEGEQAGRRDARPRQRNRDLAEGLPPAMAGDAIGMLDVRADVLEIAAHDPQDERQADQLVDPDQADIGVGQVQMLEEQAERQQHQQRRREAEGQQREGDVLAQPELVAREGIGRRHAQHQRQQDRAGRQQQRVAEVAHEGDVEVAGGRLQPAGQQCSVVLQRRLEEQARRNPQDLVVVLERHQQDPEDREQEEHQDQRDQRCRG